MELELNSQDWIVNANEQEHKLELKDMKSTLELLVESKSMVYTTSVWIFLLSFRGVLIGTFSLSISLSITLRTSKFRNEFTKSVQNILN